ncbi:MAG: ferrochelatase [Acidobacteriaceae bacterium]|nr:ferrochelatase [Acidobacteriaceae bacterium]
MSSNRSAILLLAHGTPNVLGDMAEYLSRVTGRPMPDHIINELRSRYAQIGLGDNRGSEPPPLTKWTLAQRRQLEQEIDGIPVYVAMRNWHPLIADVVGRMRADGVTHIKAICLAPQNSRVSVGLYRKALLEASAGMKVDFITDWADHPLLAQAFAEQLWPVWALACAEEGRRVPIIFTAHSVPCSSVVSYEEAASGDADAPDPYPVEVRQTAAMVARCLEPVGLTDRDWYFAFQSQGIAGGPWLGPTVEETLKALHEEGHTAAVIQPIGFLCDHVEVLYDIDIAFQRVAKELGMKLWRTESLNDSPLLTQVLADIARSVTTPETSKV